MSTADEYREAAEKFGMESDFCEALGRGEVWEVVRREPGWVWIGEFVEERGRLLRREWYEENFGSSPKYSDTDDDEDAEHHAHEEKLQDAIKERRDHPDRYLQLFKGGPMSNSPPIWTIATPTGPLEIRRRSGHAPQPTFQELLSCICLIPRGWRCSTRSFGKALGLERGC